MNKKVFFGTAFLMLGSSFVFGQEIQIDEEVNELDEVVISDSKFSLKREQSGKVITKITAKELERSQGQSVATVLTRATGLFINGNGSAAGQNLGVYVRGGRNRQVVIRVDGVTVSDPSTSSGDFDLRLLSVNQIQEIEILKGASSTLYGSGAAAAVINIITKSESKKKIAASFQSSIGTNQSQEDQDYDINEFVNLASINGTLGKVNYLASIGNQFSDGLSAAEAEGAESDAFSKFNVYAKLGYRWNDNFRFHFFGNLDQYKNDFDAAAGIDGDNRFESQQLRAGSFWEIKYPKGSFTFTNSFASLERDLTRSSFPSKYEGNVHTFDAYNKYTFNNTLHTVIGANGSYSKFSLLNIPFGTTSLEETISDSDAEFDIIDPYINVVYASDFGFNLNVGARYNIHSTYDNHVVYNINPSYTHTFGDNYIKGLASYSTAYITPSLFQLYDTAFLTGNPDLKPEESTTIEGGVELSHKKKATVSVVYFNRKSENFITFNPTTFMNFNSQDDIKVDGVEVEVSTLMLEDKLSVKGNYTYTNIDKLDDNIRIPKHMINASIGYQLGEKTYTSLNYQYNTKRIDNDFANTDPVTFAPTQVSLDSYGILDFYISHRLLKNLNVYAAMHNITNEDYQEILGFSTKGRNARVGITLEF
ncbi:vitamin B12 transporter [Aquimarina sp. EL_43]|uniref:TonB-dependent receptor plug domain-containing protein n=1 Tax=unclassified Aquimarina TaxID=2627091 RepID=UPI0018CA1000|nr:MULTISPECIES: TonB-dependent receptor [unclassified Aquimarina]MBG6133299.1 vitamin B12 transporter [Aquimarina sp. EL_35]MBG6153522.1 vitamin B12 transporter [Aquimarina sp. EL_32]MBG6171678.1 vitamin B12 transporter [Aquimarina sp. EL_43]